MQDYEMMALDSEKLWYEFTIFEKIYQDLIKEGADENEINDILNLMKRIRYVLRDRLKTTQMYFDLVDERINETER